MVCASIRSAPCRLGSLAAGILGLAAALPSSVQGQNLLLNPDMEDCPVMYNTPPTDWGEDATSAGADCTYWATGSDPGLYGGGTFSPRTQYMYIEGLTQTVATTVGVTYTASFWVAGNGGTAEIRMDSRSGALIASAAITPSYAQVSGTFVASGAATTLYFGTDLSSAATGDARIDDACVTSTGSCVPQVCGNGVLEGVETCDDANATAADGCSDTCQTEPGYTCATAGAACVDDDECAAGTDDCDVNATCTNTPGSFECACNVGYAGDGRTCADVDECAAGTDDCHEAAFCTNTMGSFDCMCEPGFTGDGVTCELIPPTDGGLSPDAGPAPVDAGVDAGPSGVDDGGCGCRVGSRSAPSRPGLLGLGLLLGLVVVRRRSRAR
jgi:MYXO-CTERM domain-containing protein